MPSEYRAENAWLVVADAGAAYKERPLKKLWGEIALAWQLHREATDAPAFAAGATYLYHQSINRAEHLAVLAGLRCLVDGFVVHGEWVRAPVHVVTDSALVVELMTGVRHPDLMRPYCDAIEREAAQLEALTGQPVQYARAGDEPVAWPDNVAAARSRRHGPSGGGGGAEGDRPAR